MSDDKLHDLFIATLKELKDDIRQLDNKTDEVMNVLVHNTSVLEEHERRSTASEARITTLEDKHSKLEEKRQQLKGFFIYMSLIITALGSIGAVFHYWVQPFLFK